MVVVVNARLPVSLLAKHLVVLQISNVKTNNIGRKIAACGFHGTGSDFLQKNSHINIERGYI